MIPVNLLPWREKREQYRYFCWYLLLVGQITIAIFGYLLWEWRLRSTVALMQSYTVGLQQQQTKFQQLNSHLTQQLQNAQRRKKQAGHSLQRYQRNVDQQLLLQQLVYWMPEQLWLSKLTIEQNRLHINGSSIDSAAISQFLTWLQAIPSLQAIKLDSLVKEKQQQSWQFIIIAIWGTGING